VFPHQKLLAEQTPFNFLHSHFAPLVPFWSITPHLENALMIPHPAARFKLGKMLPVVEDRGQKTED
jgi:hypothetical protein